ncbi:hypothetical protein phiAS5_ORF0061 [Aeromonas phage phiAS5]|uniref:Uncharacterized protein n=1 Tax=Aeromonas phage phiAS5 TaxID=879630 RepID=E1A2F8_9CAUD|nr:hypothetical protein phiAS5_ORF0061 [Aeromonas phage phiAS5]ADM79904.1 hypothetical protein phiAS5_ORF0061 [Aeromonas phage phiAS5]BES53326.1 hypothetical protein [Aeromonas phage phiWae14]
METYVFPYYTFGFYDTELKKLIHVDNSYTFSSGNPTLKLYGTQHWMDLKFRLIAAHVGVSFDIAKEAYYDIEWRKRPDCQKHPDIVRDHLDFIMSMKSLKFKDQSVIIKVEIPSVNFEPKPIK